MTTTVCTNRRGDAAVLRRVWRLHFWIGLFAAPMLVVLACSGLVILYSQPIDDWLNRDLFLVEKGTTEQGTTMVPLDDQLATATSHVSDTFLLDAVIPPAAHMGNQFGILTRIMATATALGVILSVMTGLLMWWKRRPAGKTGLPSPASAATRADTPKRVVIGVSVAAAALGVIYPAFGVSLLLALAIEAVLAARRRSLGKTEGREDVPVGQPAPRTGVDDTLVGSR
ncbi:MAG: PepSY domain-containing protein [Mycobacterium sp.]